MSESVEHDPPHTESISNQAGASAFITPINPTRSQDSTPLYTESDSFSSSEGIIFGAPETPVMPPRKNREKPKKPIDSDLGLFLERLLDEIDLSDEEPHEILQGLASQNIRTWNSFMLMENESIQMMTKPHRHIRVPLSSHSVLMIGHIKQMIDQRIDEDDPSAEDINTYTKERFIEYVKKAKKRRRDGIKQSINSPGPPAFANPTSTKSQGEKRYEAWNRTIGKRSKGAFSILKEDDNYRTWKPLFEAELAHQKLLHVMNPSFDPSLITCPHEKELWADQKAYLWTIILHVFMNPLGRICKTAHMKDKDPRAAYFEHHKLQEESPAKAFNTTMHLTNLQELKIRTFTGSRVDFLATWFETLRYLNELSTDTLSYSLVKSLLLASLHGDKKLSDLFPSIQETNHKDIDIETLKTTLLHHAALYDSQDQYLKTDANTGIKAHSTALDSDDLSFLIHRATRTINPEARLPDDIFDSLDPEDRKAWRLLPESTRIKFARLMQSGKKAPPERRIYFQQTDTQADTQTTHSDITDDSTLVQHMRQLLIHNSQQALSSPSLSPPSQNSNSNSQNSSHASSKPSKSSLKTPTKSPKLSSLDPANPAAILADNKVDLFDSDGVSYGYVNKRHKNISMNFHRWYTDADDKIDDTPHDNETTPTIYRVSQQHSKITDPLTLIDRGANGCVAGSDCKWIGGPVSPRNVSITGIDNHQLTNIPIGTVGAYANSNRGPVICIFHEVAYTGRHKSILSSFQLEHYGNQVHDKHPALGGKGTIETPDGYIFPLAFTAGLAYIPMRKYTRSEYQNLPHVIMTSDNEWDPTVFDKEFEYDVTKIIQEMPKQLHLLPAKEYNIEGEYIGNHNFGSTFDDLPRNDTKSDEGIFEFWLDEHDYTRHETINRCIKMAARHDNTLMIYDTDITSPITPRIHTPGKRDYELLKPYFSWIPTKLIEATFKNSTQFGYLPSSPDGNLFKRWKAPNPAMNVFRLQDDLLTDKVYSDTSAIDSGHTEAQIFFGRKSHIIHVEPISKKHPFIKCLQNFVRKWGAPLRLLGDHAGNQASHRVMDFLRMLWIGFWCSEAYYKHQNMFERRYQTFKRIVNRTMARTNTPPELWYLCMEYVAYLINRVSDPTLGNRQPIFVATGQIGDISTLLPFKWMEPVYYRVNDSPFPSSPTEHLGYWVGISEHVGHAMTFKIWNKKTGKILDRSAVRTATDESSQNELANNLPGPMDHPAIGIRIAKEFSEGLFFGTVHKYKIIHKIPHWNIKYDDGDSEDFNEAELHDAVQLYTVHKATDTSPPTPPSSRCPTTTQHYGEQEPGEVPDKIYSISSDGKKKSNTYAEDAYLSEEATPEDYLSLSADKTTKAYVIEVVLTDDEGQPQLDHTGNPILIEGSTHEDLQGTTFLTKQDDGTIQRARVLDVIENKRKRNKDFTDFRIKYDQSEVEDIMSYNEIMNHVYRERLRDHDYQWKYRKILSHQGPLTHRCPGYKGSKYNIEIEWENGERTFEPIQALAADDPVPLAIYARDNNLLHLDGWKKLRHIAKGQKKFRRMTNQAKLKSFRTSPKYMYGFQVPRTYEEALELDKRNKNTKWADATALEMKQLDEYNTFIDMGTFSREKIPKGFKRIKVHLVFAVKHDGRHKSRLVSRGDLTDIPITSVYAGVVSLRGLRMCIFLAELNNLEAYATDIGNAYLEAITQEKVCIKAGPEFGSREGHLLIIYKALYGLRSSGKEFGDLLAACLKELGFFPSRAEPEIFMRENDGIYEYVATYVDDLCLVMKHPLDFLKQLQEEPYNFKLKGSGPMSFHLGCGFERDHTGTLRMDPRKYIDKMVQSFEQMFGHKPSTTPQSPLPENDHPELDTTEFLDEEGIQQYQSLIGSLQWAISIGRWDVHPAVMTMSSFRAQPRKGHLERLKRIYGYIYKFRHFSLRFRTEEPDMSYFDDKQKYDWSKTVYEDHPEEIPHDAPKPLGKRVTLIHYFDANLMHDVLSGKAVTGCIHLANKTPIMWYSKKQATSETATYGAEFIAGRTCIEHIIDLRNTFRYLGVPIHESSYMFGDNETMIQSSSYPYARLHKRHHILSYHFVRSMIARGFISMHHVKSKDNLADILTKHWSHNSVYGLLRPIFHHAGNTASLYIDDTPTCLDEYLQSEQDG